ncbi:hypothetical protein [Thalassotalea castellviae]|uniref:DUF87 domain-containing protein n=1 Tax=Thalassotalea castellviae TaxID=3075612 RepID=A0ABU3A0L0_9GAMM|nr:hypothetical protein [Thalassotalea sp. W431]MDT0603494.1 hypothetical protein [Thalassotalea sp. W431]
MAKASRIDESLPILHHAIIGSTGSGKTTFIKRHPYFRQARRLIIWDPEGSFTGVRRYTTKSGFLRACKAAGFGDIRIRLELDPTPENYEWFCSIVWPMLHAAAPMTMVGEELADVTGVGKASKYWGFLSRKGRKYGLTILGASQRPQEMDKTFLSQARFRWCGILNTDTDQKYMANIMQLSLAEIAALDEEKCEFYLRQGSKPSQKGRLTFKTKKGK